MVRVRYLKKIMKMSSMPKTNSNMKVSQMPMLLSAFARHALVNYSSITIVVQNFYIIIRVDICNWICYGAWNNFYYITLCNLRNPRKWDQSQFSSGSWVLTLYFFKGKKQKGQVLEITGVWRTYMVNFSIKLTNSLNYILNPESSWEKCSDKFPRYQVIN